MQLHKIVRGTSRRADIAYESPTGQVEYDDIEDPLPFDINAPIITIEDTDYALWYRDMGENMDVYDGKTVCFKGLTIQEKQLPKGGFVIGRHVMTCCADDITFAGLVAEWKDGTVENKEWATVTAEIRILNHPLYGRKGPVLTVSALKKSEARSGSSNIFLI